MASLLLDLGGGAHEPLRDETVHLAGVEAEGTHVGVEDLAEDALQLDELVARRLLVDGLHPLGHDAVPHLQGDDVVGDQAEEPVPRLPDGKILWRWRAWGHNPRKGSVA